MNMFYIIADSVLWITGIVIVLSVLAVISRYISDIRQSRILESRLHMRRSLNEFFGGVIDKPTVIRDLEKDRTVALGVLIDYASQLPRDDRLKLKPLFEHFRYAEYEMSALCSSQWAVRARAASHLGYMNHETAIPPLVRALDDEILDVRLAAARALAQMAAFKTIPAILNALALPAAWPLQRCSEILFEMGNDATTALLDYLKETDPAQEPAAVQVVVRVLGMLRDKRAIPKLSELLRGKDAELRIASTRSLGQIGDPQVSSQLSALLADPVWEVRSAAAQALGQLGQPAAVYDLNQALTDDAWWVRFNAAEGLLHLGKEGRAALQSNSANHRDPFARDICRQILEEHGSLVHEEGPSR